MLSKLKHKWKESFEDWNYIFMNELQKIFKDQGVFIFCVLLPLAYPLLYTWIYNNEVVNDVPVVVVDDSHSATSREYIRKVDATSEVKIVAHAPDMMTARRLIEKRKVYGIMHVPRDFEKNILQKEQTFVSVFVDMSGLLYYKALVLSNTNVSLAMNADIRVKQRPNNSKVLNDLERQRIPYEQVDMFNPQVGFASFLIPAVLVLILQQALVLGIGLLAGTERDRNGFRELIPINRHYHGLLRIILGKAFAYLTVFIPNLFYVLGVVPHMFHLPQLASGIDIFLLMIPFLLAVIFFGMTVSVLIRQRESVFMIIVFTSVPLLFMTGISWPAPAIPTFWKYVSYLFPSTFGVNAYVGLNSLGATMADIQQEWYALWIQAFVYFGTTILVYRNTIRAARKRFVDNYERRKKRQLARQENRA